MMDKRLLKTYIKNILCNVTGIVVVKDDNVMCLNVNGKQIHLFIKNLTYAGNPYPINTTRAQLPKRDEFEIIKQSNDIFLFLGYDEINEVFACWDPAKTKARLNEKEYVSFFSRLNLQESVIQGKIKSASLSNGLQYILFNINDLPLFLLNINEYFNKCEESEKNCLKTLGNTNNRSNIMDENTIGLYIKNQLSDDTNISMLSLVSKCMNEFGSYDSKMKLSDWQKIIKKYVTLYRKRQGEADPAQKSSTAYNSAEGIVSTTNISEGAPWSKNEEISLKYFYNQGRDVDTLAKLLGRTVVEVRSRLNGLGYIDYTYENESEPTVLDNIRETTIDNSLSASVNNRPKVTIDIKKLKSTFDNKVTSYKYFWFVAITSLVKERKDAAISYEKLLVRMATIAWPIVLDYGISLGDRDMLIDYLNNIQRKTNIFRNASKGVIETSLLRYYDTMGIKHILSPLLKNVPYRFLSPWVKFSTTEDVIDRSRQENFDGLYALYPDRIVLNPQWLDYIELHYDELCDFTFRSFVEYIKQYNNDLKILKLISKGRI